MKLEKVENAKVFHFQNNMKNKLGILVRFIPGIRVE